MANTAPDAPHTIASKNQQAIANIALILAAGISFAAALAHLAVIAMGPDGYRLAGAGEEFAQMAEAGHAWPAILTSIIATLLTVWGLYALSAAAVIRKLPLIKTALIAITSILLLRGIAGMLLVALHGSGNGPDELMMGNSCEFWLISSAICCSYGACFLVGELEAALS